MAHLEQLTPQEREWALALDEAIYGEVNQGVGWSLSPRGNSSNDPKTTPTTTNSRAATELYGKPSDFEIVAHAIRAKGDVQRGLRRLKRMKMFKDEYSVPDFDLDSSSNDPLEPILRVMKKFHLAYPHFIQKIGMDKFGRVAVQLQLDGLRWSLSPPFNHTETERFQAFCFLLHATQPTLESIRRGTVWIGDLRGISQRPSSSMFRGARMLFRDSYPIKVEDIPVVDCPPKFSVAYATTYPFLSSHFVDKFVRVTPEVLRQHFPPELLSDRLRGINNTKNDNINKRRFRSKKASKNNATDQNTNAVDIASMDGDESEASWENLDDDDDDVVSYGGNNGNNSGNGSVGNGETDESEVLTRIERLLRMRFETEKNFRLA
ncbi:unnamed protein product [Pseudo-nitzschia multistriata]|uniref:CRAL-TRIO domain-containing protein n=1 Tax=Pseudo-nitzschia multistriata TaxID=183589 RepID=A0A448ZDM7_9STRA|nr:unnamed protein product [Pseudo-nitzschia multistriata]